MNNLLYNARMALRDIMEVNIFTKGTDRVYLSLSPELFWDGNQPEADDQQHEENGQAGSGHTEKVVLHIVDRLQDMDMVLAGENAISALMESEPVEILRKVS